MNLAGATLLGVAAGPRDEVSWGFTPGWYGWPRWGWEANNEWGKDGKESRTYHRAYGWRCTGGVALEVSKSGCNAQENLSPERQGR